jgi:hypothetical protein
VLLRFAVQFQSAYLFAVQGSFAKRLARPVLMKAHDSVAQRLIRFVQPHCFVHAAQLPY